MKATFQLFAAVVACILAVLAPDETAHAQDKPVLLRTFTGKDGKTYEGRVLSKTSSSFVLELANGKSITLLTTSMVPLDEEYIRNWDRKVEEFREKFSSLTIRQLLEARGYQSFEYFLRGNHIFVDGKLNGQAMRFMIDTGAGTSLFDVTAAQQTGCQVGEMTEWVYGIGGKAPAAVTRFQSLEIGDALIENRKLLSADLFKAYPTTAQRDYGAIFGADFLRELDAVINYRENRVFMKPRPGQGDDGFQVFTNDEGKAIRGKIQSVVDGEGDAGKAVILEVEGSPRPVRVPVDKFSEESRELIGRWDPLVAQFRDDFSSLSIRQILEALGYQSFDYFIEGNHIFVDGILNETNTRFMIDTGAGTSLFHIGAAQKAGCEIGEFTEKIYGIGGEAPAARTKFKSIQIGEVRIPGGELVSADMFKDIPNAAESYGAILGADYLRAFDAVISYKENRMFMKPTGPPPAFGSEQPEAEAEAPDPGDVEKEPGKEPVKLPGGFGSDD